MGYSWDGSWDGQGDNPSAPPSGWTQNTWGDGSMMWTGGGEAPIMTPQFDGSTNTWRNMNGGFGANYTPITASSVWDSWGKTPSKYKDALSSMQFDPISYATINGGAPSINNDTDFQNTVNWQKAIMQTPSFRGEGNFDNPFSGMMQMYSDLGPFLKYAGMAYGGFGGGLESLFGSGTGTGAYPMDFGLGDTGFTPWTGGIDGTAGGLGNILGDTGYWSGADALTGGQFSPNALDSVTNMSSGLDNLGMSGGNGITVDSALNPTNVLDPSVSSLAPTDASAMMETADLTPTSADSLGQGLRPDASDPFGIKKPSYSWENKDFLTGKNGTGMEVSNADFASNPIYNTNLSNASPVDVTSGAASPFTQGLSNNNLPDIFKKLTTPVGGKMNKFGLQSLFQAPTPLGMLGKVGGALMDMNSNRDAMKLYENAMSKSGAMGDSNAARGAFANSEWQRIQSDPNYGNEDFMNGSGRDFVNQARAAAAKNGSRGSYLNSGKMLSDLYSKRLQDRNNRAASVAGGFANNPYAGSDSLTPGYASLVKNQYAPIGQAISNIDRMYSLSDMFGGA